MPGTTWAAGITAVKSKGVVFSIGMIAGGPNPRFTVSATLASALILMIFGYGQGLVMAPLSGVVLSSVKPASAGSGSGMYGTTAQIANAAGVAAIGAVFFAVEEIHAAQAALFVSIALFVCSIGTSAALLSWMRRASA